MMNCIRSVLAAIVVVVPTLAAAQPTVPGNEAVVIDPKGRVVVELPPVARNKKGKAQPEATFHVIESKNPQGRVTFGPWVFMIETDRGLQECMRPWFEGRGCRPSTVGSALGQRFWIVKHNGEWLRCPKAKIEGCGRQLEMGNTAPELQ